MAESTLSLGLIDLQAEVGKFLGYGRGSNAPYTDPAWSTAQQQDIDSCMKSGYRQFLFPPPLPNESASYDWSFTKPVASVAFAAAATTVPLPDDFGGFEGQVTVQATATSSQPWVIEWRNEGSIRAMYAVTPSMTGPPMYVAQQPLKGTTAGQGQKNQLLIFPGADQAYTLQFAYYVNPDALTTAFPFPYGGTMHAETIRQACLMAAEQFLDDASGVQAAKFMERLAASVSMDRRNKPQVIGPNMDRSDDRHTLDRANTHLWAPAATYNGSAF